MPQGESFWNPYRMIPVRNSIERKSPVTHEKIKGKCGRITCTLENLTPLFVSDGKAGNPRLLLKRNGIPVIPGSSLKGMLRSLTETIGGGCCISDDRGSNCHKDYAACSQAGSLCIACRMFGMMERKSEARIHQGNVGIGDALLRENSPQTERLEILMGSPATRHQSFYLTPQTGKMDGKCRKFYFHQPGVNRNFPKVPVGIKDRAWNVMALKPGHHFDFEVSFSNLREEELGLLLYVLHLEEEVSVVIGKEKLKLSGPMCHKIGNAKPMGLGSCHISVTKLMLLPEPSQRFRSLTDQAGQITEGDALANQIRQLTQTYVNDRDSETMQQLRKIMVWDEKDSRSFHYPDYTWFKNAENSGKSLKEI